MGNGKSQPAGLIIEDSSVQTGNFWTLHPASFGSHPSKKVTVFIGAHSTGEQCALEKFSKNLMLHRHPNILKYVAAWKVNGQYHLVSEEVQPLSQVLDKQTPFQICIGFYSILKALNFLHEKAKSSHNNVCQAAVYVTADGQWKLGGLEYLCPFQDISASFLKESQPGRYERGISPNESTKVPQPLSGIDLYAFGILGEEILSKTLGDVPGMKDFLDVCRTKLQDKNGSCRPAFSVLLEHPFFSHKFIKIHDFLSELPLKSEVEKQDFFSNLVSQLKEFDESVIGSLLGGLLLSRLVLLDGTAQKFLLPKLLNPRNEKYSDSLLSEDTFRKELVPRLMSIFLVRDLQVRLTLLSHFSNYCSSFNLLQLQTILPEILLGIKDTNDVLVMATLKSLADLVPILGSSTVIGGKRMKLFSDGRPKAHDRKTPRAVQQQLVESPDSDAGTERVLSERHSPDGGEAPIVSVPQDDETWHQWDSQTPLSGSSVSPTPPPVIESELPETTIPNSVLSPVLESSSSNQKLSPLENLDLKTLEVKQLPVKQADEEDFFCDMEPVISKASVLRLHQEDSPVNIRNKFIISNLDTDPEGWGDDLEWAEVNDQLPSETILQNGDLS